MTEFSRRRFLQLTAATGGALVFGHLIDQVLGLTGRFRTAAAGEPIKIGILDPLSSPYNTSSIHDIHGANVAVDLFNKKGGVLGRPVVILEADDASNPDTAVKVATKFIKEDCVDVLMGTFNGDCALAVSALAQKGNTLFMVTGAYLPELTGVACNAHTFVFMPSARMMAQAVAPHIAKAYGTRWYMITAATVDGKAAVFRASDHQHVKDVLVGEAFGKELGLGHYKILATVPGETVAGKFEQTACRF
jgi:branched-chain amino acid transport system substrate-binding protein